MKTEILGTLITSVFTLVGVIITVVAGHRKTVAEIKSQTDLTIYRIEQLEAKQDKHNQVMERTFMLEARQSELERQVERIEEKL